MERIRVVHLVNSLQVGGLEKVVYNLMRFCDRAHVEPSVWCLGAPGALASDVERLGVPVRSVSNGSRFGTWKQLVSDLRGSRPHVLHTHNPQPHYFGVTAACLARVPVLVHTKHGRNRPDVRRRVALNNLAARLSSRVVCVSANAAEVARHTERVPPGKLRLIRNGIGLAEFAAPDRPPKAVKRAIHVARLNIIKDQRTLLRAVRLVVDEVPDFTLDIVGDGEERAALESLHAELHLSEHVRFLGERSDVSARLRDAGMFVLSSAGEGLSLTLLEAMASGLPIVATNVGGNPEVVAHEKTGLLVPPGSPFELARAILTLIYDPNGALRMGRRGRERVEAEFDMRQVAARYESLYRELVLAS